MDKKKEYKSALKVQEGIPQPPNINPEVLTKSGRKRRKKYSVDEYIVGILSGNRTILSQAITLVESSLPEHYDTAQAIIEKCLPHSSGSIRIGITGVPGAGKSTFIETFGLHITGQGRKLAVMTIDPSSEQTKGSILGDKTRMEQLSIHPDAFIRPSPAAGTLGGVARKTRETIILCEAAGFDTILVETVGVGQSETAVHSMVDFFLLLMLAGAGDELQGIKRGIMEMADLIAITKADGPNKLVAEGAKVSFQNALHLFPVKPSGWKPQVLTCSALTNKGIGELWKIILDYIVFTRKSGYFEEFRRQQEVIRMNNTILEYLKNSFYNHEEVKLLRPELERQLYDGSITSYKAAVNLLDKYFKR
ncbi:MAG: methylmalonyl Co-A mutase-associated GTPase MeaB [Bacteroidia bacterium]|nr:methylmalonyl Co-A mutase-associated GTPase MeaB [Bacteroidia bacterium]